ncbi:glycosyltransferase family 4 protein [Acinetobacter sp. Marseille-Q1623]|uniref:glycosyltransferase family 4 protein n=1 Tax=Acinetobacter sp. Marseille-Q1623 TaxID=2697501 RepID=UPI00157B79D4|nr:glycosyltransferase family 4 protein [Acinetobacter sp. Marseille-Q1623]
MKKLGIWFPTVRTGTGTDIFTQRLVDGLNQQDIRAEITWLPLRAEYLPWTVPIPKTPEWANIIHVNTWLHSRFLPKNLLILATLHHSIHDPNLRPYKGILRALYHQYWIAPNERRVMQRAQQVTSVSQFVANMAKQTLCNVPTQVIYNGIDTNLFCPGNRVRQKNEPFRLLYVGSWMSRKGVDLLSPIMRELGEKFELYYTGGVAAEKDKETMPNNMHDLGYLTQTEVVKEMQKADAFLFPSRSEGLPLVVLEALSCGLPVIALKGTAVEEIIDHQVNGYLVKNINEAVSTINKIYENTCELKLLSAIAREQVNHNFSEKSMLNTYIKLYKNLSTI